MSALALREAERAALTPVQRALLGCCTSRIVPGQPAPYMAGTVQWAVYHDTRVTLDDVALGGAVTASILTLVYDPTGKTREQIRLDLLSLTSATRAAPEMVPHTEGADRIAEVWAAQLPPAWAKMTREVPAGWVPKSGGSG